MRKANTGNEMFNITIVLCDRINDGKSNLRRSNQIRYSKLFDTFNVESGEDFDDFDP